MPPLLAGENFEIRYINVGFSWLQRVAERVAQQPSRVCLLRLLRSSTKTFTLLHISSVGTRRQIPAFLDAKVATSLNVLRYCLSHLSALNDNMM